MADDEAEPVGEPLEWLPEPVELLRYDAVDEDDRALRVCFDLVVADHPPGCSLSAVNSTEQDDRVTVDVILRDLVGTRPDGTEGGRKLNNC